MSSTITQYIVRSKSGDYVRASTDPDKPTYSWSLHRAKFMASRLCEDDLRSPEFHQFLGKTEIDVIAVVITTTESTLTEAEKNRVLKEPQLV